VQAVQERPGLQTEHAAPVTLHAGAGLAHLDEGPGADQGEGAVCLRRDLPFSPPVIVISLMKYGKSLSH
jgi:hypothetical protein